MTSFKRILAALPASLMPMSALASCSGDTPDTTDTTAPAETTTAPAETEPRETERHEIRDDLPADLTFGGITDNDDRLGLIAHALAATVIPSCTAPLSCTPPATRTDLSSSK